MTKKKSLYSLIFFFSAGPHDICQLESYNVTCGPSEAVIMRTARWGRMRIGQCVKGDYGYLGCATNVLDYVSGKCSGRSGCKLSVPDPELHKTGPCPEDFSSYLEVSYSCVKGEHFFLYVC